jgi:hypothetical protein
MFRSPTTAPGKVQQMGQRKWRNLTGEDHALIRQQMGKQLNPFSGEKVTLGTKAMMGVGGVGQLYGLYSGVRGGQFQNHEYDPDEGLFTANYGAGNNMDSYTTDGASSGTGWAMKAPTAQV